MEENKKVVQALTDEELMDLVGGANFIDRFILSPIIQLPVKPVVPPIMAVYAIWPITKTYI